MILFRLRSVALFAGVYLHCNTALLLITSDAGVSLPHGETFAEVIKRVAAGAAIVSASTSVHSAENYPIILYGFSTHVL